MRAIWTFLAALTITGCAQKPNDIFALDGSRADGMITVAFQGNERFGESDFNKALTIAKDRCVAWGYQDSAKFGSRTTRCTSSNYFGCASSEMIVKYQCLGNPDAGARAILGSASTYPSPLQPASAESREARVQQLMQQDVPYEEYQKRYREIMGQ
jgi:hypothetical protein